MRKSHYLHFVSLINLHSLNHFCFFSDSSSKLTWNLGNKQFHALVFERDALF